MTRTPTIALATALACTAGAASAGLVEFTITGVVTDLLASHGPGAFSDLRVGDTWIYTMVYNVADGFVPPAAGSPLDLWATSDPISFVSASFNAGGSTLEISEHDLSLLNDQTFIVRTGPDGRLTSVALGPGPRGLFDMQVSSTQPDAIATLPWTAALNFNTTRVSANYNDLLGLSGLLPFGIFGPTADGDRWATFDLEGGRFGGLITGYSYSPFTARVVPAPGAAALLLTAGLAATRRRR